ncbi:MAG TPA: ATP-dependent Clp protease proteolytic subunit [Planktothrix sp.]|jgi:ATP-dependent Clp endopeptidase proteolytic subunit ClpP
MSTDLKTAVLSAEVAALEAEARGLEARLAKHYAKDVRHLAIIGEIHTQEVANAILQLHMWQKEDRLSGTKKPIIITLNVMGGNQRASMVNPYIDAFALVDYMRFLVLDGYDITLQVTGTAAQQGVVILQTEGVKRVINPHSQLMFTEEQFGVRANSAEMRDKLKFLNRLEEHGQEIVTSRTNGKVTIAMLKHETEYGRQWILDAARAVELGLVDAVDVVLAPGRIYTPLAELMPKPEDTLEDRKLKAKARRDQAMAEIENVNATLMELENTPSTAMFVGPVGVESCAIASAVLQSMARRSVKGSELDLLIYSPGGSVVDGVALLDVIEKIKSEGHKLRTTTIGCAASMGGFLLQAGSEGARCAGKNSRILIHRMASTFVGGNSQLKDQEESIKKLEESVLPMLIGRSKLTMEEYMAKTEPGDWWIEAPEALERGIIDKVI